MKIKESSYLTMKLFGRVHTENVSQNPNVNNLMHRRTRRGVGEGGRPLAGKISGQTLFFSASASCSKILHGEKNFNTAYIH